MPIGTYNRLIKTETRVCTGCKIEKSLSEFYKATANKTFGLSAKCKDCIKITLNEYYNRIRKILEPVVEIDGEIWKDVVGYENMYQVSNLGRVKSVERKVNGHNNCINTKRESLLKPETVRTGYYRVVLQKNGKRTKKLVHTLVGTSFISNPNNYVQLNHKNAIKKDNTPDNLEWTTQKENIRHASKMGLLKGRYGKDNTASKLVLDTESGIFYYSVGEAAKYNNFKRERLSSMLSGRQKNKSHLKYV